MDEDAIYAISFHVFQSLQHIQGDEPTESDMVKDRQAASERGGLGLGSASATARGERTLHGERIVLSHSGDAVLGDIDGWIDW